LVNGKLAIALVMLVALLPGLLFFSGCATQKVVGEPRALIIDQLFSVEPNQPFIEQTQTLLAGCGFKVDLYQGDQITVDLLRGIAETGYRLIIFRAHAGLLNAAGQTIQKTCIFTNEPYSETKHVGEQLSEKLAKARINADYPWVFAVGADFVSQSMKGRFDRTMVIMEGCSTLYIDDLAKAFIQKGASVYTGWNLSVSAGYVDDATDWMLKKLVTDKATLDYAVSSTLNQKGRDPDFGAVLKYYPPENGQQTLTELASK
jgi:hypothetical protein